MYINGAIVSSPTTLDVVNPSTEEAVPSVSISLATKEDVELAVLGAVEAGHAWKELKGKGRAKYLRAIAEEVQKRKAKLSELETMDCGKPLPESEWDIDDVVGCFNYYAEQAIALDERQGSKVDIGDNDYECSLRHDPVGVVGAIIPFNYPLLMLAWKVGPALAAGCTVVIKPSEHTSVTAIEFAQICIDVGLPKGVLNIVTGPGQVGEYIVKHPKVSVVAFTGSVPTGTRVAEMAAPQVKQVTLELGGKSAAIVLPDTDLNKAAEWVVFGSMWTNGQICSATSRLLVHESISAKFIGKLKIIAENIKIGDPMDPECRLGPLVSKRQQQKVLDFIARGIQDGAKVEYGGKSTQNKGFFVEPTILTVSSTSNPCWQSEIFGPVLTVMTFKTDEEALALANSSDFGLAAAVFTNDKAKLAQFANDLEVGIVWQQCSQPCFVQLPWGGRKLSGFGRDLGEYGLNKFLEPKQVVKYVGADPLGWYDTSRL